MEVGGDVAVQTDASDNHLLNRDVTVTPFQMTLHSGDSVQVQVMPTFERLERDFTISPGITLPRGEEYRWTRYRIQASMAQRRIVAFSPSLEVGSFYNGSRRQIAFNLNLRLRPGVIIYSAAEWNHVDLDEGEFETRLVRIVPEVQFSPWIAWVNNIQYDTQSHVIGWQSRFRWILTPGSDLYIVYTHNWQDDPLAARTYTLDQRAASKLLYTFHF